MAKKAAAKKPPTATPFLQSLVQWQAGGCLLRVKVVPKAKKLAVVGVMGESLKVALTAAAERGEANRQLQEFLAELLDVPPSHVILRAGLSSRNKLVFLAEVEPQRVVQRLQTMLGS